MNESQKPPKPFGIRRGGRMHGGGPMARGSTEKAKNFSVSFRRLARYLSPQKFKFLMVVLLSVGSTVFYIIGPKIMGLATTEISHIFLDKTKQMFDVAYVAKVLSLMVFLYILSAFLSFISAYIMSDVSQKTVYHMRNDVKNKLDKLSLKYFDSKSHGEILSRVTNDMDTISSTLQQSLTQIVFSCVTLVGILIVMLSINWIMTLITLVTLPFSAMITVLIAKNSQRFYAEQQKQLGELNGHVEEMYAGHKAVKVFNQESASVKRFREINLRLYEAGWKAQFMSGIVNPALHFVGNIGYVVICVIGGVFVARRQLTLGDVQAFIQYVRSFSMPITQTANIANIIQATVAAAERVFEVLDELEETEEMTDLYPAAFKISGKVTFKHVEFGYKPGKILIQDMNIDVKSGQTIAIVGPTGAGKTTLVNLLMRFYELDGGIISIDGVSITNMRRSSLRKNFGIVLQDTWLFNGTIFENIQYGCDEATTDQVINAAKAAHADHFIRTLPNGYDTVLNEEASNISHGQKQLLTIARAILAQPAILILDEATSNVDTRTEVLIQKAMGRLMKGRTSFVIAHRLSTIKNADSIIVMNHGSIIEQGSHQELLNANGFYADLYNSQFSHVQ